MTRVRKRRSRGIGLNLLFGLCLLAGLTAESAGWGKYSRILQPVGPRKEYGAFVLDADVYAHARADLADLRILDGQGYFVPIALKRTEAATIWRRAAIVGQVFRNGTLEARVDLGSKILAHQAIQAIFEGTREFVARVSLESREEDGSWTTLAANGTLARLATEDGDSLAMQTIRYPASRSRHLLLRCTDLLGHDQPALSDCSVRVAEESPRASLAAWPAKMRTEPSEDGQTLVLTLDLGGTMPVEAIGLRPATPLFFRHAVLEASMDGEDWLSLAEGDLFQYRAAGVTIAQTTLAIPTAPHRARYYRILIAMDGNQPLSFTGAEAHGQPDEVIFAAGEQRGPYRLAYGVEEAGAPQYDLAFLVGRLPAGDFSLWSLAPVGEETPGRDELGWLLWVGLGVGVAVLVLAGLIVLRRTEPARPE